MSKLQQSQLLLLLAAAIWGFAFVAQIAGMKHLGPFSFMAARFGLGCLAVAPLLFWLAPDSHHRPSWLIPGSLLAGGFLFTGAAFQQVGLQDTSAANAGFITSLYIVLVPLAGLLIGRRAGWPVYSGAALAFGGLYFLSVSDQLTVSKGDWRQLAGAFAWTGHVFVIGWLSKRCDPIRLALGQYSVVALLSGIAALALEQPTFDALGHSWIPIAYTAVLSTAVAFTLQIIAQKNVPESQAALIMSAEAVFAAFGGWLLLNEVLSLRGYLGCGLMLAGIILAQINLKAGNEKAD
jgi:drug/metabolite transporter (DMT)-like permease